MSISNDRLLVSILIPCKNAGLFLDECISSIIAQDYTNWELIIVDDHSSDLSLEILLKRTRDYDNIKVLRNKGTGIINALRMAYASSNGQLITRMDADDVMTPIKLSTMVEQLETSGVGSVATGVVRYFRNDKPLGDGYLKYAAWLNSMSQIGSNFKEIYKECVIPSPCWMMFREDFDEIGGFERDIYPEDYDLVFRMYKHGIKVIPTSHQTLHLWRDHSHRASRNDENYTDNRFIELKMNHFLNIDYKAEATLVLWGAGSKAKRIAQQLNTAQVDFNWITDNHKKIGHNIYGHILSPTSILSELQNIQLIISVANLQEQEEIKNQIQSFENSRSCQSFWFC